MYTYLEHVHSTHVHVYMYVHVRVHEQVHNSIVMLIQKYIHSIRINTCTSVGAIPMQLHQEKLTKTESIKIFTMSARGAYFCGL